nr:MAG TPA: hypothetical protein [Caudoviricetes sp.]
MKKAGKRCSLLHICSKNLWNVGAVFLVWLTKREKLCYTI